jgi:hypothetical protein
MRAAPGRDAEVLLDRALSHGCWRRGDEHEGALRDAQRQRELVELQGVGHASRSHGCNTGGAPSAVAAS